MDTSHKYAQKSPNNSEDFELGYLCGILQGDGCLTLMKKKYGYRVCLSTADTHVLDFFNKICEKYAGKPPRKPNEKRKYDYWINSKRFYEKLVSIGLTASFSYEKQVPAFIYSSRGAMAGFVSGLFDTDGTFGNKKDVVFQLTAEKMLRQLQVILSALGVDSLFRSNARLYKKQKHIVHHVIVRQNDIPKLFDGGVVFNAKKSGCYTVAKTTDAHDGIPREFLCDFLRQCAVRGGRDKKGLPIKPKQSYKSLTRGKVRELANWAYSRHIISETKKDEILSWMDNRWVPVKEKIHGTADFYDLTVEEDHSYWSNGFISHNTLSASVVEVLAMLHCGRNVAHMAAIQDQALKAQEYVKRSFRRPYLRDFVVGNNERITKILRYYNSRTEHSITQAEYEAFTTDEKGEYVEIKKVIDEYVDKDQYVKIVICTMSGANSEHVPLFCVDGQTRIYSSHEDNDISAVEASVLFKQLGGLEEDLVVPKRNNVCFAAVDPSCGELTLIPVIRAYRSRKNVYLVKTSSGRSIRCTAEHQLLTQGSFKAIKDLKVGDEVIAYLYQIGQSRLPKGKAIRRRTKKAQIWYREKPNKKEIRLKDDGGWVLDVVTEITPDGTDLVYDFTLAEHHNYITENGLVSHNCIDEVDVVSNPTAYAESQNIPAGRGNKLPITILTSTRKQAFGLVQKEIDNAQSSGLNIRSWNIIDVTEACPPSRHEPEKPRLKLYVSSEQLRHVDEQTYNAMNLKEKEGFVPTEGFAGCKKCKLFPGCKTRLATHQTSTSSLLKSIPETVGKFKANSIDMAKAQLLCLKPSSFGLVYSRLDKTQHVITPAQAYELIFGEDLEEDHSQYTKIKLLQILKETRAGQFIGGIDWGHSHNFVYVQGFKDGNRCFVTNFVSMPGLDPDQMLEVCEPFLEYDAAIFPDNADPKMGKLFLKKGYNIKKATKGAGSVASGINVVKWLLNPPGQDTPNLYFIHDILEDPMMTDSINKIAQYHWTKDAAGQPTEIPSGEEDDEADALRYMLVGAFKMSGSLVAPKDIEETATPVYRPENWMTKMIQERTGQAVDGSSYYSTSNQEEEVKSSKPSGKRRGIIWDI